MDAIEEIKKELKTDKLIIGVNETISLLRQGQLSRVFVSSNCPDRIVADVEAAGKSSGVKVEKLQVPNDELGTVCKKQFSISVLGERKQ